MKTIYQLKLHEGVMLDFGVFVMRVPGGWIYDCWDTNTDSFKQGGYFVPYDTEFKQIEDINVEGMF